MIAPTPVWVVDDDPAAVVSRLAGDREVIDELPGAPWDLSGDGLVWPVTVADRSRCPAVLEAVIRGVAVVVRVLEPMSVPTTARFVDELHRAAGGRVAADRVGDGLGRLTAEQRRLLDALAGGVTVADAGAALGLSTRTASRRLTEARVALGCATTVEAVVLVRRRR